LRGLLSRKIRYAILDDVEQYVVVIEDGSMGTVHFNGEFIVVNWYSRRIIKHSLKIINEDSFTTYLDSGIRFFKDFPAKKYFDKEVLRFLLYNLYGEVEFERDKDVCCFCSIDLEQFLFK